MFHRQASAQIAAAARDTIISRRGLAVDAAHARAVELVVHAVHAEHGFVALRTLPPMTTLRCKSLKSYFFNAVAPMAWGLTRQSRSRSSGINNQNYKHYVNTAWSAGRAQSDAMTRARSAASASEDPSEA